ncbi:MAG TPA: hypothetical protein PLE19_08855 [Planctomycetota bacterium]|nr:hypothetical protein [Planctomycetota bacterium]HRR80115.1 hypothetical protein [Planctomycetota bacterium]HRT95554.1 hypothetical protein [Planctomycetota bacterium]
MSARWLSAVSLALSAVIVQAGGLPEPRMGGKGGGPISVLFVMGPGGAGQLPLDPAVAKKLDERGYLHRVVADTEPLTLDYLRQFSVVVLAGLSDFNGGSYYAPGGVVLLNTAANVKLLQQYVGEGGGLVVVPLMAEAGSQVAATLNAALAPWGMEVGWETVRDDANAIPGPKVYNAPFVYSWTRSIARHPATEGVRALAYPGVCMRWDDAYSTNPLLPKDRAWKPLAWGEKTSRCVRLGDAYQWVDGDSGRAPVLAAVREAGKGRVAVVGLGAYYLLSYAFDEKRTEVGENSTGPLNGIAFERGDGKTPSDWGILFDNLLRWAAEASTKAGLGGKPEPWQTKLKPRSLPDEPIPDFAVVDWKRVELPPTWAHHAPNIVYWRGQPFYDEIPDPLVTKPQEMNKLLVGPRTRYSEGRGSIAQWARAAKAAGYRAIVFAERFEKLRAEDWPKIIADCERNSTKDFACLQGMDIADDYGNRYLILGNTNFPPKGILTPDGKGLQQTSRLSLGFSGHIAVVHRLGNNKGLPTELCRHFQGVSVYTYAADGKGGYGLADDAFAAYQWQLFNASNPVPIVVHELTDPRQVAKAAATGFQQIVPSQDVLDAIRYFRYGMAHFFENPQRYFITEGPIIDKFAIFNKDIGSPACNRDHWRAIVGASSPDATIKEAVLCDRGQTDLGQIARRWLPNKPSFSEVVDGDHGHQHYFMLEVTDSKGRRAISPHLRTVPRGYFTRCADRQNWFGAAGSYTGIWPSGIHSIWYIRPHFPTPTETEEFGGKNPLASMMGLWFASNAANITHYAVERRYVRPITYGMDAWRIENTEPSRTFTAQAGVTKWHDIVTGIGSPAGMNPGPMAFLTRVDAGLSSRVAVSPTRPIFPIINSVPPGTPYRFVKDGQAVEGKLDGKPETLLDLPAGASLGDILLLDPLTVSGKGEIGWRAEPDKEVRKHPWPPVSYMYIPWSWRSSLGAEGPTPWSLQLSQGKVESVLGYVNLAADKRGVAGTLKAGGEMKFLPLLISGLSERWPAALWTPEGLAYSFWSGLVKQAPLPGTTSGPPFLAHVGVHVQYGHAALPNGKDTAFYVGNTLISSNWNLVLAWTLWTATEAGIEVHNPTDETIKARVWSAKAIPGKFVVDIEVVVPPGTTQRLRLSGK